MLDMRTLKQTKNWHNTSEKHTAILHSALLKWMTVRGQSKSYYTAVPCIGNSTMCYDPSVRPSVPWLSTQERKVIKSSNLVEVSSMRNWKPTTFLKTTRWNSTSFRRGLYLRLPWPWPFDLTSMSQAQVHTRPNFGEISSNIYEDIVFTPFSGHCLLRPWPLTFDPKS